MIEEGNRVGEAIEFRLDLFDRLSDLATLKNMCVVPTIFTLRKASQGGAFAQGERQREGKLLEMLLLNPDYVDLEYDTDLKFVERIQKIFPNIAIISSYHNFKRTPSSLKEILDQMNRFPAAIYKIATHANSSLDSLRMLIFVQEMRKQGIPLAGMCMGKRGSITRILSPVVGSLLTYAPLKIENQTELGQVRLETLKTVYRFSHLNSETAIYALIGDPVDKSVGHIVHNALFDNLRTNTVYVKIALESSELPTFFHLIKQLPFKGLSVTMPLKEEVLFYLDGIDLKAKQIGAVNTLVEESNRWKGFNTDGLGALDAIEKRGCVRGKKVVILGAGGTAKALAFEAIRRGGEVLIVNRTEERGKRMASQFCLKSISMTKWQVPLYDILINATSVGMFPQHNKMPISKGAILPHTLIFDAVFSPKETQLLSLAKSKGCRVVSGCEMFARQAVKQLEIWLSRKLERKKLLFALHLSKISQSSADY